MGGQREDPSSGQASRWMIALNKPPVSRPRLPEQKVKPKHTYDLGNGLSRTAKNGPGFSFWDVKPCEFNVRRIIPPRAGEHLWSLVQQFEAAWDNANQIVCG